MIAYIEKNAYIRHEISLRAPGTIGYFFVANEYADGYTVINDESDDMVLGSSSLNTAIEGLLSIYGIDEVEFI